MIHRCFLCLQSLHNPLVHIYLFVSIGQLLPDAFYLLVILGSAL